MSLFRKLWDTSPTVLIFCLLFGVISGFSNTALIACINKVITNLGAIYIQNTKLFIFITVFISLIILRFLSTWLSQKLMIILSQKMIANFRTNICQKLLVMPLHEVENIGIAKIFVILNDDTQTISRSFILIPPLLINLTIFLGCMIYIAILSLQVFMGISIIIILGVFSYKFIMSKSTKFFKAGREHQDIVSSHFKDLILGIKELKLSIHKRNDFKKNALNKTIDQNQLLNVKALNISSFANAWAQALYFIMIGLALCFPLVIHASSHVIISVVVTMLYFTLPLQSIINLLPMWKQSQISSAKINNLMSITNNFKPSLPAEQIIDDPINIESITLEQIEHTYHNHEEDYPFHLGPLNMTLKGGEITFIVGGNGSGKSTLAKILCGLYHPNKGLIKCNNQIITDVKYEMYRQNFSTVFSDFHLFKTLYGLPNTILNSEEIKTYLDKLNLSHKVKVHDNNLSTLNLSHGQRKRLALLVSYLENKNVYLFDEWAADQDPIFKDIFYRVLLKELKERGKTIIVISHDEKYFDVADQLIKLDNGKIIG